VHLLVGDVALPLDEREHRVGLERVVDDVAERTHSRQVGPAAAGDVGRRVDAMGAHGVQQVRVDPRRFEERRADAVVVGFLWGRGRVRGRVRIRVGVGVPPRGGLARQREPVRVDSRRPEADDRVAGPRLAVEERVLRGEARAGAREIQPPNDLGHHGRLAADEFDAGLLGAFPETRADLLGERLVRLVDREVVDERHRPDAGGDHVVDVHGDAVDSDRGVVAQCLGDEELRADAVGRQREVAVADVEQAGVVARAGVARRGDQRRRRRLARVDVDARLGVRQSLLGLALVAVRIVRAVGPAVGPWRVAGRHVRTAARAGQEVPGCRRNGPRAGSDPGRSAVDWPRRAIHERSREKDSETVVNVLAVGETFLKRRFEGINRRLWS
jgi:hypothetical protein